MRIGVGLGIPSIQGIASDSGPVGIFGSNLLALFLNEDWDVSSGRLDTWYDRVGGYDLTAYAGTTNRPSLSSSWNNGLDAVLTAAAGGSQGMKNTSFPQQSQPMAVWVVGGTDGAYLNDKVIIGSTFTSSPLALSTNTGPDNVAMISGSPSAPPKNTASIQDSAHIICGIFNGASGSVRIDGVAGTAGTTDTYTWGGGQIWIGQSHAATQRIAMFYQEIAIVSGLPTSDQIAAMDQYLADKFAISI